MIKYSLQTAVSKPSSGRASSIIVLICLLLGGLAVFVFGSPYYQVFVTNRNQTYNVALAAALLIIALVLKRNQSWARYGTAVYALFIAMAGTISLKTGLLQLHRGVTPPLQNLALDKFSQFLVVTPVLIGLTLLAGEDLASIFVKLGNWKRGLRFGLLWFVLFGVAALIIQWGVMSLASLLDAIPWILLYIFANATMEELWFRGIFLRKFAALISRWGAILVTAVLFGTSHINATYYFPGGGIVFGLVVFALGVVGAHAMLKDDSLIGPILFHAGYDLMIIVPVINSV